MRDNDYRYTPSPPSTGDFLAFFVPHNRGGVQGAIERAAPTLAAAHAISRAVSIPVMAASGLSDITAPMALAAGARGVGVGSAGESTRQMHIQVQGEVQLLRYIYSGTC